MDEYKYVGTRKFRQIEISLLFIATQERMQVYIRYYLASTVYPRADSRWK